MTCTSLQGILQNGINFCLSNRKKKKIDEHHVLLQEFHQLAAYRAEIDASIRLLRKKC